jgi:hypothetical protein
MSSRNWHPENLRRGRQYALHIGGGGTMEILKCILVCHNCHSEIHTGMVRDDVIKKLHQDLIKRITPFLNKSWNDIFEYDE